MPCSEAFLAPEAAFGWTLSEVVFAEGLEGCSVLDDWRTCAVRRNLTGVLYTPTCAAGACPPSIHERVFVLVVHGGAYSRGEACTCFAQSQGAWWAARGATALSIDYRLEGARGLAAKSVFFENYNNARGGLWHVTPTAMYAAIRDARAAVRFVRAGLGAECVLTTGHSAGGTSAMALAALSGSEFDGWYRDEVEDPSLASTHLQASSKVDGAAPFSATVDFFEARRDAPSTAWLGRKPPMLLVHGADDPVNVPTNSEFAQQHYNGSVDVIFLAVEKHAILHDAFQAVKPKMAKWAFDAVGVRVFDAGNASDATTNASGAVSDDAWAPACWPETRKMLSEGNWDCPKLVPKCLGEGVLECNVVLQLQVFVGLGIGLAALGLAALCVRRRAQRRTAAGLGAYGNFALVGAV
mmetsp:Transcript_16834/g.56891  ORF Transcript_16834/g.56891 Transcript_16834/m.56891 type:complete len:410 (+) Transcript_16834:74-1303(+)